MPAYLSRGRPDATGFTALGTLGQSASALTIAINPTGTISVGETIIVFVGYQPGSFGGGNPTCAAGSNTFTRAAFYEDGGQTEGIAVFTCEVTQQILTSGTITVTFSQTCVARLVAVARKEQTQIIRPLTVDVSSAGNAVTSAAPTPGTSTPTNVPDDCFALYYTTAAAVRTGTPPAGWTERFDFGDGVTASMQVNELTSQDKVASNPAETLSASGYCLAIVVRFKMTKPTGRTAIAGPVLAASQAAVW